MAVFVECIYVSYQIILSPKFEHYLFYFNYKAHKTIVLLVIPPSGGSVLT